MPRRFKRGAGPSKRGRHKKAKSRETRKWLRMNSSGGQMPKALR